MSLLLKPSISQPLRVFRFYVHRCLSSATSSFTMDPVDPLDQGFPWHYRGEGNSSLVLSSRSTRTVLRLRKVLLERPESSMCIEENSMHSIVNYVENVVKPLVPCSSWIPKMKVVQLRNRFHALLQDMRKERDPSRLKDAQAFHTDAVLMRDLAFLPEGYDISPELLDSPLTFSVELKPKEGLIPTDPQAHPLRRQYSKYTLKQLQKVREGSISQVNEYDPMDLFSGDKARMQKALSSLVTNPQNNLRVFVNGTSRFGSKNPGCESLGLVLDCFFSEGEKVEKFLNLVVETLCSSSTDKSSGDCATHFAILDELLRAQKSCLTDVETLHPEYLKLFERFERNPGLRDKLGIDGPDYGNAPFWTGKDLEKFGLGIAELEGINQMRGYLASATLKDCSVFLTFQKVHGDVSQAKLPVIKLEDGSQFIFHASLVDLDPKPIERIGRHYYEAQKLIQTAESLGLKVSE